MPGTCTSSTSRSETPRPSSGGPNSAWLPEQPSTNKACPATYSDATCKTCGACTRLREDVIGFPAHGRWRQVEAATAARDVALGVSWTFPEHRTMAEVIADET